MGNLSVRKEATTACMITSGSDAMEEAGILTEYKSLTQVVSRQKTNKPLLELCGPFARGVKKEAWCQIVRKIWVYCTVKSRRTEDRIY